nr:unnamed protein product [Callosobruchus chinensis]
MDNPDLTFFVELFGESGGLLRKISSDDKGALSDVEWKESIFQILHMATNHIPTECREETGLIFDVALGESLDIGFIDGKKNFKITQKCSKLTNKALETFFRKLRELEVAVEIEEDLVDKSKLLTLIDEWKNSKV